MNYLGGVIKLIPILFIFTLVVQNASAQPPVQADASQLTDSIVVIDRLLGSHFEQNGERLSIRDMHKMMRKEPTAFEYIRIAQRQSTIAMALGAISGFMIAFPVGMALAGGEPEWMMAAIGGGALFVAFTFGNSASKNAKRAVVEYNAAWREHALFPHRIQLEFGLQSHGIGWALSF